MRAAVCRAFGEPLVIEDVRLAAPDRGEVRVRLAACAICQSDLHYLDGRLGRLAAGGVRARGGGGRRRGRRRRGGLAAGDHVVVTLIRSCGTCSSCAHGEPALCDATFALDERGPLTRRRRQPDRPGAPHGRVRRGGRRRRLAGGRDPAGASARPRRAARLRRDHGLRRRRQHRRGRARGERGRDRHRRRGAERRAGCRPRRRGDDRRDRSLGRQARDGAGLRRDARRQPGIGGRRRRRRRRSPVDVAPTTSSSRSAPGAPSSRAPLLLRRAGTMVIVGMPASGVLASIDPGTIANDGQRILGSKMGSARIERRHPEAGGALPGRTAEAGRADLRPLSVRADQRGDRRSRGGSAIRNVIVF